MKHQLHLIFGEHPFEERPVEDRAGDLTIDEGCDGVVESRKIQRDNRPMRLFRQALDEPVPDLSTCSCDQHDGLAHAEIILEAVMRLWLIAVLSAASVTALQPPPAHFFFDEDDARG